MRSSACSPVLGVVGPNAAIESRVKKLAAVVLLLALVLWATSGLRSQQTVGSDNATVQAQMTAVVRPTPSPTP